MERIVPESSEDSAVPVKEEFEIKEEPLEEKSCEVSTVDASYNSYVWVKEDPCIDMSSVKEDVKLSDDIGSMWGNSGQIHSVEGVQTSSDKGHECKLGWNNHRDQYCSCLRKTNTKSGQESDHVTKCRCADEVSFIKPLLCGRDTVTNLEEETMNTEVTEEMDDGMFTSENTINSEARETLSDEESNLKQSEVTTRRQSRTTAKKHVQALKTSSAFVMKYLLERKSKKEGKPPDAINLFFQSIATTVRKFSPYYQNICKTKVLAVVSKLEREQMAD